MKSAREFKDGYTRDFYVAIGDGQPDCVDSFVADLESWAAEIRAAALREVLAAVPSFCGPCQLAYCPACTARDNINALIAKEPGK